MCIFIYFRYAPPPTTPQKKQKTKNLALPMKQNPLECKEASVSVTSASGRLGLPGSIRPPQVPAFAQEATVCNPDLPQLGGLASSGNSRGTRWPARGVLKRAMWSPNVRKLTELGIPLSRKSSRGPSLAPWGPFPRGAWGENTPETLIMRKMFIIVEGRKRRPRAFSSRGRWRRLGAPPPRRREERRCTWAWEQCGRARVRRLHSCPSACAVESAALNDFGGRVVNPEGSAETRCRGLMDSCL